MIAHASTPAESLRREQPYLVIRSQATRTAYGVDRLKTLRGRDSVAVRFPSLSETPARHFGLGFRRACPRARTCAPSHGDRESAAVGAAAGGLGGSAVGVTDGVINAVRWRW